MGERRELGSLARVTCRPVRSDRNDSCQSRIALTQMVVIPTDSHKAGRMQDRELKLTAALYACNRAVVEHVRNHGRLPEKVHMGGAHIGLRLLIRERGNDIELTETEQLVYDAIIREGRVPGGQSYSGLPRRFSGAHRNQEG